MQTVHLREILHLSAETQVECQFVVLNIPCSFAHRKDDLTRSNHETRESGQMQPYCGLEYGG